jgi:hypothetical protein
LGSCSISFAGNLKGDLYCYFSTNCHVEDVAKQSEQFGKFVRLKLTSEIVEVVGCDSSEIMINYKGRTLTMSHYEVSKVTPEEGVTAAKKSISA